MQFNPQQMGIANLGQNGVQSLTGQHLTNLPGMFKFFVDVLYFDVV